MNYIVQQQQQDTGYYNNLKIFSVKIIQEWKKWFWIFGLYYPKIIKSDAEARKEAKEYAEKLPNTRIVKQYTSYDSLYELTVWKEGAWIENSEWREYELDTPENMI